MAIALRYAALSDVGLVRRNNQDSAYAGPHLLVVADGMGGHAGGDVASSLAIGELAPLDDESHGSNALEHLKQAVLAAHRELLDRVHDEPQLTGMGTTVTALLRTGGRLALAHIGDSRAYVMRDGELVQITRDHTFVQTLVDEGRLTQEEAEQHPQRSVLMRVLSDVVDDVEPDLSMREARLGDRYLLCSDGLSGVVSFDTLQDTLKTGGSPAATCEALVQLALRAGAPDNVTCIVADVIEAGAPADSVPSVVGAATLRQPRRPPTMANGSAAERAAALTAASADPEPGEEPSPRPSAARRRRRRTRSLLGVLGVLILLAGGGVAAWNWVMGQYYVGTEGGSVAIFRGLPQDLGPVRLSSIDQVASDVPLTALPSYQRDLVRHGIQADTRSQAQGIVQTLRDQAAACRASTPVTPTPTPNPTGTLPPSISATTTTSAASVARSAGGTPSTRVVSGKPTPLASANGAGTSPAVSPTSPPVTPGQPTAGSSNPDCAGIS